MEDGKNRRSPKHLSRTDVKKTTLVDPQKERVWNGGQRQSASLIENNDNTAHNYKEPMEHSSMATLQMRPYHRLVQVYVENLPLALPS